MSAVISYFRPAQTSRGGWSQQELAEFYRVEAALIRAGMPVASEQGVSDEAEPWFVFCRPDGDDIMHFARIDGNYMIASAVFDSPMRGTDFRALINQIAMRHPELLPIPRSSDATKLAVHPAALLAALVVAAALALAPDDALASEVDRTGASPAQPDVHLRQPTNELAQGGASEEQESHRKQYEAMVFSAMIFAATAAVADRAALSTDADPLADSQGIDGMMGSAEGDASIEVTTETVERPAISGAPSSLTSSGLMGSGAAVSASVDPGGAAALQPGRTDPESNGGGYPPASQEHLHTSQDLEKQAHSRGTDAHLARTAESLKTVESVSEAGPSVPTSSDVSGRVSGSPAVTETATSHSTSPGASDSLNETSTSQGDWTHSASQPSTEVTGTSLNKTLGSGHDDEPVKRAYTSIDGMTLPAKDKREETGNPEGSEVGSRSGHVITDISQGVGSEKHSADDLGLAGNGLPLGLNNVGTSPATANDASSILHLISKSEASPALEMDRDVTAHAAEKLSDIETEVRDALHTSSAFVADHNAGNASGLENSSAASHAPAESGLVGGASWELAQSSPAALAFDAADLTPADQRPGASEAKGAAGRETASASHIETLPVEAGHPQAADELREVKDGTTTSTASPENNAGSDLSTNSARSGLSAPTNTGSPASAPLLSDAEATQATALNQTAPLAASVDAVGNIVFSTEVQHSPYSAQSHAPADVDVHADVGIVGVQDHGSAAVHHLDFHT